MGIFSSTASITLRRMIAFIMEASDNDRSGQGFEAHNPSGMLSHFSH